MDTIGPVEVYNKTEEEEKKLILREYRGLLRVLRQDIKKGDKALLRHAFEMAVEAHKNTRRKSGEPYILHPIAVARICVEEIGLGVTSAICGLLHDTVEDTEITLDDIRREFNNNVAKIIDGLTKISNVVDIKGDTTVQAENFRKILLTLAEDPRVILIKLADRLHNMRTLGSMSREKQLKIASETTYIYSPLAHRLGLYEIKSEMEDLSLKYTQPEIYEEIVQGLKETKRERTRYINEFIKPIKETLGLNGFNFEIFGRPKAIHSIFNKMRKKHVTFDEVYDIFAIRIILKSPTDKEKEDCWKVYSIITNIYHPNPERLRDWISVPKGNGYEALHTTVMGPSGRWVEVQIRTERMNEIAEKGLAAHWKYKEGAAPTVQESKLDSFLEHLREILANPNTDTIDFIQDFKLDLFTEEIYVYTPKGDMRVLPKGATALDFAFDIHTQLGARCIGAKVNHKLVPLSHKLSSGDQVEVITSAKQHPSEDWLHFVVTAKAKSGVKNYLKEDKRKTAARGKEMLKKKLENMNTSLSQHNVNELVHHFKKPSALDMYYAVAVGNIDLGELKHFGVFGDKLQHLSKEVKTDTKHLGEDELLKGKSGKGAELIIFGEKSDKILYKLAQCCQPIPGDDVFGFVTSGEGLKIHRTDCPNAAQLLANYGHRVVKTKWAKNKEISFLTGVRITGLDDVGVIQKITNIISGELKLNMRSISIDSKDGMFEGSITIYVHDREELNMFVHKLSSLEGITKIERIDGLETK